MTTVTLTARFGDHHPGDTIQVDDITARWLVGINRGTSTGAHTPVQQAAAPGGDGPDPLAGGDPTRLYGHVTHRAERTHNQALPIPGSPIQYNMGVAEGGESTGRPEAKQAAAANRGRTAPAATAPTSDSPPASGSSSDTPKAPHRGRKSES